MRSFIRNQKGSLSVEASIVFLFFVVLIGLIADTGYAMLTKSRLERLSYSFLGLLRQNDLNIVKNKKIVDSEAKALYSSALRLSEGYIKDPNTLGMVLELFEFENSTTVKLTHSASFGAECKIDESVSNLAIQKGENNFLPLYRVGFCFQTYLPTSQTLVGLQANAVGVGK